jgi:hypothetical protein
VINSRLVLGVVVVLAVDERKFESRFRDLIHRIAFCLTEARTNESLITFL